jgi:thiamine pyrophosphate-dependent acetolactate synthase large subunit-like protein
MSEAAIPAMLRNAIAVALREKTAVHLALPVDIQSKLISPPRTHGAAEVAQIEYQASEARLMIAANAMRDPQMRVVIALGHRAATELEREGHDHRHANPYVRLAETLNAPIVTQLDAKGCVDESHSLAYGVLGVFGNPGLDAARTLVSSADLVLLFGVDRQAVDLIAERIRALGAMAPVSSGDMVAMATIPSDNDVPEADQMVINLSRGHETLAKAAKEALKIADDHDDPATADLLTVLARESEKTAWMLRSSV